MGYAQVFSFIMDLMSLVLVSGSSSLVLDELLCVQIDLGFTKLRFCEGEKRTEGIGMNSIARWESSGDMSTSSLIS